MPFNLANPFQPGRIGSIMSQPVDKAFSGVDFNPASQAPRNPFQQGGIQNKRLFTGIIPQQKYQAPQQQSSGYSDNTNQSMESFYQLLQNAGKNRPAQTAYQSALSDVPDRRDYAPSKWRILAASLAGTAAGINQGASAGLGAAETINETPYRHALQNYDQRIRGLEGSANLEYQDIQDQRQNITAAGKFALDSGAQNFDRFIKTRQADRADSTAEMEYQKAVSEANYRLSQARNAQEANQIRRELNTITQQHNQAQDAIGRTNAGANVTRAGAAVTSAGAAQSNARAAQTRADNTGKAGKVKAMNADEAYKLALHQMHDDPQWADSVQADEYGYNVTGAFASRAAQEARNRASVIMAQNNGGGFGTFSQPDDTEEEDPYSDSEIVTGGR